jgi:hypothetical protein
VYRPLHLVQININREHIYRTHRLFQCVRCFETFRKKPKLDAHQRADCEIREKPVGPIGDGVDDKKVEELRGRVGLASLDEVSKWERVYRIVFGPDIAKLPSPCKSILSLM